MKFGTLSFMKSGSKMTLNGALRKSKMIELAKEFQPMFIACAGWSLENFSDLQDLANDSVGVPETQFFVEVENDPQIIKNGHPLLEQISNYSDDVKHAMFVVKNGEIKRLGTQYFAQSGQLNAKDGNKRIAAFEKNLASRCFEIGDKPAFGLCCGELNILWGRDNVVSRSKIFSDIIENIDILINPTHDRMGNAGTLKAKRKLLSTPTSGRDKLYVSISNWAVPEKGPRQHQDTPTLHTVYFNGNSISPLQNKREFDQFEFRLFEINWKGN